MLREHKEEDMRRLYFLLSRVPNGLPNTSDTFQVYLIDCGTKIVAEQKARDIKEAFANGIPFVKKLMEFYEKYFKLVAGCFSGNPLFKSALDKVFPIFLFLKQKNNKKKNNKKKKKTKKKTKKNNKKTTKKNKTIKFFLFRFK